MEFAYLLLFAAVCLVTAALLVPVAPLVAAYTVAASSCEKQRVMFTRMPCCTDIFAARSPRRCRDI